MRAEAAKNIAVCSLCDLLEEAVERVETTAEVCSSLVEHLKACMSLDSGSGGLSK